MTISHRTLLGEDGQPEAAVIPWDVFVKIQRLVDGEGILSAEETEILDRRADELRNGTARGLSLQDLKGSIQAKLT